MYIFYSILYYVSVPNPEMSVAQLRRQITDYRLKYTPGIDSAVPKKPI